MTGHEANSDQDCNGDCFGEAFIDDCGVCSEGNSGHDANSDQDCNGDWFGSAFFDACGICSEGNTGHEYNSDQDCNGDCFGTAFLDDCGICSGGNTGHDANSDQDCSGECFGDTIIDECGVCGGDNSSCADCYGTPNGDAFLDDCGVCSGGLTDHIPNSDQDCNGLCFGNAIIDDCGECTGGNTGLVENYLQDCNGVCNGTAEIDDCGVCSGGDTGIIPNADQDCNGDCFGEAFIDDCGVCSEGNSGHDANSDQDCNGDCFGLAFFDDCGICSEGNSNHEANSDLEEYYFDLDQDTFGSGESSAFCNVEDCQLNCIPENWVSNNLDPEPECYNLTINDLSIDECGICNGDNYEDDCIGSEECSLMDCSGQCFGISELDECGICEGDNTSCNVPYAEDFEIELNEDELSSFVLPITDQNGDPISLEIIFSTLFGDLTFDETTFSFPYENASGNYLPESEFSGLDEFSYYVVDNQGYESDAATASITVNFVDDSPQGSSIVSEVDEDQVLLVELVGSDIDTEDSQLSFEIVQNPNNGLLSSVSRLTDQYYYTPNQNYHGLDTLLYKVYDGNSYSQDAFVYISVLSVNDAPTLSMDETTLSLNENSSIDMIMDMSDVDGDELELHILQNPVNGSIINWDPNGATFTYVPNDYFVGLDNITLYAEETNTSDNLKSTVLSVDLNVLAVNDPPVSFDQSITIQEDQLLELSLIHI